MTRQSIRQWYQDNRRGLIAVAVCVVVLFLIIAVSRRLEENRKNSPALIAQARALLNRRFIVTGVKASDQHNNTREITFLDCEGSTIKTFEILTLFPEGAEWLNSATPGAVIEFEWTGRDDMIITQPYLFLLLRPKVVDHINYESAELHSPALFNLSKYF